MTSRAMRYLLPPYRLRWLFQIEADDRSGIGNVRDTDGIEVSDSSFGPGCESGLVVLQDGENRPHRQNFKYPSWASVTEALELAP